jgi:hypothetical protein
MPPRDGRGQVGEIHAKSTCIIAAVMPLEAADEPISESSMTEAPRPRAFSASEMIQCGACSRANPPTRASCLYCGAALEVTEPNAFSPASATAREFENGSDVSFHVVAIAPAQIEEVALEQVAWMLELKPSDLQSLLGHPAGAPVFAVDSAKQAQIAADKLHENGIRTRVISDELLGLETPPFAIAAFDVRSDALVGRVGRSKQTVAARWDEIRLVVIGRLYFETRAIDQKRSRAKRIVDEREMLTDEAVLDIYPRGDDHGWRIRAGNFDFSCLGDDKHLTAFANFSALTTLLREHMKRTAFDDSYVRLRSALNNVWPSDPIARTEERRRTAFGDFDSSVTSIDNELQFTRYSRLLRCLHASQAEDHAAQT